MVVIACVCMASVALEGGALYPYFRLVGTCPWCPPASATYASWVVWLYIGLTAYGCKNCH